MAGVHEDPGLKLGGVVEGEFGVEPESPADVSSVIDPQRKTGKDLSEELREPSFQSPEGYPAGAEKEGLRFSTRRCR